MLGKRNKKLRWGWRRKQVVQTGKRRPDSSRGEGHGMAAEGRGERGGAAEGRRESVKAHIVGFERGFRRSPGGSSSRMFI